LERGPLTRSQAKKVQNKVIGLQEQSKKLLVERKKLRIKYMSYLGVIIIL